MGDCACAWNVMYDALNNHPAPAERVYKRLKLEPLTKKKTPTLRFVARKDPDFAHYRALADQMKKDLDDAILQLKNELKRMDGKVVCSDYPGHSYASQYVLDPEVIRLQMLSSGRWSAESESADDDDESY